MKRTPDEIAQQDREIEGMWLREHTTTEIADALGLTINLVVERMRKMRMRGVQLPYRNADKQMVIKRVRFPSVEERAGRVLNNHEIRDALRTAGALR